MRMDHYYKFGDNDIHMANIIYAFAAIGVIMFVLMALLGRGLHYDFK
jgi:hypothetical protein